MWPFRSLYFDGRPVNGRILDMFDGEGPARSVAVLFVHGGGWTGGSRANYHFAIRELTARGYDCASTDYRLSGVTVFDQVADVREGLDRFLDDLERRGRATRVVLAGQSAGAHLALLTALAAPEQCGAPATPLRRRAEVAGVMAEAAPYTFVRWEDIFPHIWNAMQRIVGSSYEKFPELYERASPIRYVTPSSPPVLCQHAGHEHMFPREQMRQFVEAMKTAGRRCTVKEYPRVEHGFFYALDRPQQRAALEDMAAFLEELEGQKGAPNL
jgi:acetyl esterase/lipase